jgi:hypothetical protein
MAIAVTFPEHDSFKLSSYMLWFEEVGSVKGEVFVDYLSDCWLQKKDCALWS